MLISIFMHKEKICCEKGQGIIEYVLLVALISLILIATITLLGDSINNLFNSVGNFITNN